MNKRADYTYKYNQNLGRHGWLRLTPAYSVKLVEELLDKRLVKAGRNGGGDKILDPFCGTATTGIVAAEHGLDSYLYEINPFLCWFTTAKSLNYDASELRDILCQIKARLSGREYMSFDKCWIPPMKNINRWWSDSTLRHLGKLHEYLKDVYGEPTMSHNITNLLWIAFSRLIIECSAADYGHISVSFKDNCTDYDENLILKIYILIFENICESAGSSLNGSAYIIKGDSRNVELNHKVNLVITSPPYPNRISYIRELRPYMYWLGFLSSGEEAGVLDWEAIGGTWGSATSKLASWECGTDWTVPCCLQETVNRISESDPKNGLTLSRYVLKFFYDMNLHFRNLPKNLASGCELYYVLGNSSFYGNMVHTEKIVCELLAIIGYSNPSSKIIRKRNSKKELYEFLITARWEG